MHKLLLRTPWLLPALLAANVTIAQPDLLRCAAITADPARLQCYDELATELRGELPTETETAATPAAALQPVPEPASEPPRSGVARALALFGFESRPEEQRDITEVLDVLEATVASATHSPFSGWTLTLDNGQVWKQVGSDRFDIETGDRAVITRGSLNSFLLQRGGAGRRVRVSRVE